MIIIIVDAGDMYTSEGEEEEPEWVKNEKEQFSIYRDKNHDGFMDMDEVCSTESFE